MRSKLAATTAFTPNKRVPFAAQSRDEPVPYSCPARMINGVFVSAYFIAASKIDISSPVSEFPFPKYFVTPPSVPGTIKFLTRTFANVPRVRWNFVPLRVLIGEIAIKFAKRLRLECRLHRLFDFTQARPQITQEGLFPVFVFAERFT